MTDGATRREVRARYAKAATDAASGLAACDCGTDNCVHVDGATGWATDLYEPDALGDLPEKAVLASLGCGDPTAVADLHPGETVLDLGSGGGIDVILSARRVGPDGKAYGLDMTDEMLALALANTAEAGVTNVEFIKGTIESIPLPPDSVDVVISNCVINLSTDKPAVFAEIARVLKPGGRVGISDMVTADGATDQHRAAAARQLGCTAGALQLDAYAKQLGDVGLTDIDIRLTYEAAPGLHGAIIKASQPITP